MSQNKVFFDANIFLEILLKRERYKQIFDFLKENKLSDFYLSSLSVHIVMYFLRKDLDLQKKFKSLLENFTILPLTDKEIQTAFQIYKENDFEDALQISSSLNHNSKLFLTLDKGLIKKYQFLGELEFVSF